MLKILNKYFWVIKGLFDILLSKDDALLMINDDKAVFYN